MRLFNRILSSLMLASLATLPTFASSIAQIEAQPSGSSVTLDSNPVVTVIGSAPGSGDGYNYTNYAIFAADTTGSIDLFGHLPTGATYVPAVGDAIGAAGTYSPFDAIPEIQPLTSLTKVSGGNSVPGAIPVTTAQLDTVTGSSYGVLGHYLVLSNVEFSGASGNFPTHANGTYTLTNLAGANPLTLYQWASSYSTAGALGGTPIPTGAVNVYGTVDLFNGTPEFIPFSIASATAVPEPAPVAMLAAALLALALLRFRSRKPA